MFTPTSSHFSYICRHAGLSGFASDTEKDLDLDIAEHGQEEGQYLPHGLPKSLEEPLYASDSSSAGSLGDDINLHESDSPLQTTRQAANHIESIADLMEQQKIRASIPRDPFASSTGADFTPLEEESPPSVSEYNLETLDQAARVSAPAFELGFAQADEEISIKAPQDLTRHDSDLQSSESTVPDSDPKEDLPEANSDEGATSIKPEQLEISNGADTEAAGLPNIPKAIILGQHASDAALPIETERQANLSAASDGSITPASKISSTAEIAVDRLPEGSHEKPSSTGHSPAAEPTAAVRSFEAATDLPELASAAEFWMPNEAMLDVKPEASNIPLSSTSLPAVPEDSVLTAEVAPPTSQPFDAPAPRDDSDDGAVTSMKVAEEADLPSDIPSSVPLKFNPTRGESEGHQTDSLLKEKDSRTFDDDSQISKPLLDVNSKQAGIKTEVQPPVNHEEDTPAQNSGSFNDCESTTALLAEQSSAAGERRVSSKNTYPQLYYLCQ